MGLTVVKLGSTLVADERGDVRMDVLDGLCEQVAGVAGGGESVLLVTSGAIARGMRLMGMPVRPTAMEELQAASAVGQGPLYDVYAELLARHGLRTAQVLLTFYDMSARMQYVNARQTLAKLLEWSVIPVVNENDTTATDEISFGDNDVLAAQVAILMAADLLVVLSDVDALYTSDPASDPGATRVTDVRDPVELGRYEIGMSSSHLGSGGMRSKVLAAEMATSAGIPVVICSGTAEASLTSAVDGQECGTRFHPQERRHSSFKLWLRYAKPTSGTVLVDAGAERALREQGTSLLPVGVVGVEGEFEAGDAVEVASAPNGAPTSRRLVGKGISNYSATELRRVSGMKSAEVQKILPRAAAEAVHRDYFVLA
jgi:glutamate 5-kinase